LEADHTPIEAEATGRETVVYATPPESISEPAPPKADENVVRFKRPYFYMLLVPLAFVIGLGFGYLAWGRAATPAEAATLDTDALAAQVAALVVKNLSGEAVALPPAENGAVTTVAGESALPTAQPAAEDAAADRRVVRYDVSVDDDPIIGPVDAPITIIEFSDYECPYCARWHVEVFQRLLQDYPEEVRIVYRDFPLSSIHPNAVPAAEAANCAGEQGQFWEFHDKLFEKTYGLSPSAYQQYAADLGLDVEAFDQCVAERRYQQEVQADFDFYFGNEVYVVFRTAIYFRMPFLTPKALYLCYRHSEHPE